jgi:hypothetical protein
LILIFHGKIGAYREDAGESGSSTKLGRSAFWLR